ncbi:MAG: aminotransferase class V-fold PLP-dependent enzyme [Clostridia bacterium]|nr:aminotransferase class V-fold PLP-dependent enzyme [Clostridia bacterium]
MIYFDNAATSFPKAPQATREALLCMLTNGGNPGRGAHKLSLRAAEKIFACREDLSDFLGVGAPERIIFTQNTTYALNMAIKGLVKTGDHVLCSELEHNAVMRPLYALQKEKGITLDTFPVIGLGDEQIMENIAARVGQSTTLLVCLHASNICSVSLPIAKIGAFCRAHGIRFAVDAAQSAGHLPIDMCAMQIDALALPGHKGLLGPAGCGVLALGEDLSLGTFIEGGSGVDSRSNEMPAAFPERFEAGTLPTPAIAGLAGGLSFVTSFGLSTIEKHEKELFLAARERIESLAGFEVYQRETPGGVLLFNHTAIPSTELARQLDKAGICVRAGLHCAPRAHDALGTPAGGAARLGFGIFNTHRELDALWRTLKDLP